MLQLLSLGDCLATAEGKRAPNMLCEYAFELTQIFIRFYVPELNCFLVQWQCLFDLTTNRILGSNIVAQKAAAGISDGDATPGYDQIFETEGTLWQSWMATTPGQAAYSPPAPAVSSAATTSA